MATLAGWLLWPRSSHVALCATAASVIRALAAVVANAEPEPSRQLEAAARQNLAALRTGFQVAQRRPAGATRRDRALAELATDLERALDWAAAGLSVASHGPVAETTRLDAAVVRALQASADLMDGIGDSHEIEPLVTARDSHRALDIWVAQQLAAGASPEFVLDALLAAHPLRLMSYVALTIAQNAEVAVGLPPTALNEH